MNEVTKFQPPKPLKTAILFLVFNRLDTTKKVIEFFPPEDIENYRLGPRFVCQGINTV